MAKRIIVGNEKSKYASVVAAFTALLQKTKSSIVYDVKEKAQKVRGWVYIPKIRDGNVVLSDRTHYAVDGVTGSWKRLIAKGSSQRERRRLYGKMRRQDGLTRSQAQKRDIEMARIGMGVEA